MNKTEWQLTQLTAVNTFCHSLMPASMMKTEEIDTDEAYYDYLQGIITEPRLKTLSRTIF